MLAIAGQAASLFACAPDTANAEPACDVAMAMPMPGEPAHLEHAAEAVGDPAPDAPSTKTGCGEEGMTGECLQQCVTAAISAAPTADGIVVASASPADEAPSRLIGIPPASDSPPPKS